jgi:YegS/Rv2252/BmrU family lipid kinase
VEQAKQPYKVRAIYNPQANRTRNTALVETLRKLTSQLGGADWVRTVNPGHATELAARSAREGYGCVISVGGDGTLHEIVNGLMQIEPDRRPALGIIPIGSGNDYVRGSAATLAPAKAIEHVFDGGPGRVVDVGYTRINGGERKYWINVLGIGFDAAVTLHSNRISRLHGKAMYFTAALRTIVASYDAPAIEMEIDGRRITQRVQMLTIGNGPREGGGFITTPASKVDDGLLDYAMFEPVSRAMMVRLIPEVMRGTHGRFKQVSMGTFIGMSLKADRSLLIHTDGEMVALAQDDAREVEVGVIPAALKLVS